MTKCQMRVDLERLERTPVFPQLHKMPVAGNANGRVVWSRLSALISMA